MSLKSKDRERAVYAYESVKKYRDDYINSDKKAEAEDKFKSYAKSILSYIQLNGLVAAFAFVETKKDGGDISSQAYGRLYSITRKWIKEIYGLNDSDVSYVSYYFAGLTSEQYRAVRQEIIKLFSWIRRYAES